MNSIRPLVTITILVVVGAYLYVKINEGPVQPEGAESWQNETLEDVPPLETVAATTSNDPNAAPAWTGEGTPDAAAAPSQIDSAASTASALAPATSDVSTNSGAVPGVLPAVPAIPELPAVPVGQGEFGTAPATTSVPIPTELPQNIPVAQYPDSPGSNAGSASFAAAGSGAPEQYQAALDQPFPQGGAGVSVPPLTPQDAANMPSHNSLPAATAASTVPAGDSQPSVPQNPLRQSAQATTQADPYASVYGQTQSPVPAGTTPLVTATFNASLPAIEMALERRELARALELLTPWHNDPSLTPPEAEQVETLLSRLAGTVVYSTEHQLEPARVVKPGETLETIAKEYNVPWQLLAKINGIPAADQVRPGQELKVVRGPFSAVVDLKHKELTLAVAGRYAGKFPVSESTAAPVGEGEWTVRAVSQNPRGMLLTRGDAPPTLPSTEKTVLGPAETFERLGVPTVVGLSEADTHEVADILSIGSRVVIRR
jgi:LysM repeat protein